MSRNHPVRGDYNTEALIFSMATMRFLDVFEEDSTNKMKENAVAHKTASYAD